MVEYCPILVYQYLGLEVYFFQKYKYTNNMQVMLRRLMSKGEYLIVPKGSKFAGSGKLGLSSIGPGPILGPWMKYKGLPL